MDKNPFKQVWSVKTADSPDKLNEILNNLSEEGWIIKDVFHSEIAAFAAHYSVVSYKDVPREGHGNTSRVFAAGGED
ncbi:MAG: hypothetical protein IKP04_04240 [Candidatus Methanomethylophilaceae archaeon]|nr:hypothetical protein [Candidatus Methanomethylophilaceae archaeon]